MDARKNAVGTGMQLQPRTGDSAVLQDDSFQGVAHVFAVVDGIFNQVVELFPFQDFERVDAPAEKMRQGGMMIVIPNALLRMNFRSGLCSGQSIFDSDGAGEPLGPPSESPGEERLSV